MMLLIALLIMPAWIGFFALNIIGVAVRYNLTGRWNTEKAIVMMCMTGPIGTLWIIFTTIKELTPWR